MSEALKKYIASNQRWACKSCKTMLSYAYEIDHIIKREFGGSNDIENLQALCRDCHGKKSFLEQCKYFHEY